MKKSILSLGIIALSIFVMTSCNKDKEMTPAPAIENEVSFLNTKVIFPSLEKSKTLLGTSDIYTQGLSIFDVQAKTQNKNAMGEADYLKFAKAQAGAWTAAEITNLKASIATAETKIKALGLNLVLPEIKIVKSTGLEEGGAAYTRSDYIVFTANDAANTNAAPLFLHELFHVYSRANPTKRDALYALLGFAKCNTIAYPASLANRKMTNPDAPTLEHFITIDFNGQTEDAVILLYANADYSSGDFFQYMTKELLILEGDADNKKAKLVNGNPDLRAFDTPSNLLTQIGSNTDYSLHPEEISAEHFRMLVLGTTVPNPSFLNDMKAILK